MIKLQLYFIRWSKYVFLFRRFSVSSIYIANNILSDVTRQIFKSKIAYKRNVDDVLDSGSGKMMKSCNLSVSPLPPSHCPFSALSLFSPHPSAFTLETVHGTLQLTSSISCINVKQPFLLAYSKSGLRLKNKIATPNENFSNVPKMLICC